MVFSVFVEFIFLLKKKKNNLFVFVCGYVPVGEGAHGGQEKATDAHETGGSGHCGLGTRLVSSASAVCAISTTEPSL